MEKDEFENRVRVAIEQGRNQYQAILDGAYQDYYCINLDCSELITPEEDEKIPDNVINHFFAHLHKKDIHGFQINKKSCLYFFELVSHEPAIIKEIYKDFQDSADFNQLNKSAIKKNAVSPNNILYIGKVKQGIGNRMSTHFGYANPKIGGLQLRYWANPISLKLKVHIIAFDDAIGDYINPLELNLTKNLIPLIGKSK